MMRNALNYRHKEVLVKEEEEEFITAVTEKANTTRFCVAPAQTNRRRGEGDPRR